MSDAGKLLTTYMMLAAMFEAGEPCEECGGTGVTVQGWTDKNGEPEDQYGPCATCGGDAR